MKTCKSHLPIICILIPIDNRSSHSVSWKHLFGRKQKNRVGILHVEFQCVDKCKIKYFEVGNWSYLTISTNLWNQGRDFFKYFNILTNTFNGPRTSFKPSSNSAQQRTYNILPTMHIENPTRKVENAHGIPLLYSSFSLMPIFFFFMIVRNIWFLSLLDTIFNIWFSILSASSLSARFSCWCRTFNPINSRMEEFLQGFTSTECPAFISTLKRFLTCHKHFLED